MPTNYFNIPEELRLLNQWVNYRIEDIGATKPTKIPYDAKTGKLANVNEPHTWSSFDIAVAAEHNYSGIGFVFSVDDPYTFIDLDHTDNNAVALERQLKIFKEFDSYSEISPSGQGLHIIIKGHVPQGRRRSFIEIYSSQRYATFTGNVFHNKPIAYRQDLLTQLWEQMSVGGPATLTYTGQDKEKSTDNEIIQMARNAANGDKFEKLLNGNWQDLYPSQSEADLSFINMIGFYTQNRLQITRIFRQSVLGARQKAKRDNYVNWAIDKAFDRMLPLIDLDGFKIGIQKELENDDKGNNRSKSASGNHHSSNSSPHNYINALAGSSNGKTPLFESGNKGSSPLPATSLSIPPGLTGEIAQFIYQAAPRPIPEAAIAGALGLMAGICGRSYNISSTGLNQYILLIAPTGTGKEAMASGIDRLMETIRLQVPTSPNFVGPAEISSGQALVKHIHKHPCFVSILGEFGLRLQSMSNPHANGSEVSLRRVLLDLFNKSGFGQNFRPSIYSDKDKNIEATAAPSFSILAESTPERFYNVLNEDMISEGLLPRFMLFEYNGIRVALNENHHTAIPTFSLIERFASLVAMCEQIMHAKRVINVMSNSEAASIFKAFDKHCDTQINGTAKETLRQLWNRAHIKALKIAALLAVGVNMADPLVTAEYAHWAIGIVVNDIRALSNKFEMGEIGSSTGEIKQLEEIKKTIREYLKADFDFVNKYKVDKRLFDDKIIPYQYLHRRLGATSAFRLDKMGPTIALKRAMQTLIDSDTIREVGKLDLSTKYGTTQRSFVLKDLRILGE